jgi:chromosomal replication initiator protein
MSDQLSLIWGKTLNLLEKEVSSLSFKTWFEPIVPISIAANSLDVYVDNEYHKSQLDYNFMGIMKNALKEITKKDFNINILLKSNYQAASTATGANIVYINGNGNGNGYGNGNGNSNGNGNANSYSNGNGYRNGNGIKFENSNGNSNGYNNGNGIIYVNGNGNGNGVLSNFSFLNQKYTFDTFVIGNGNKFAHAGAVAVAESMAKAYNPLFLYGEAGLGKTHLMHAIGNSILNLNPNTNVLYVTSEKFTNELINSIKDDKTVEFRQRYRMADLLLLDDVQFFCGKERTQEELFHTFNELYDSGKQIVITSDKKPGDLPLFEDRLRSRFEWGLTADIQAPDLETRIAILRKKAQLQNIYVPDDVMLFIAENIPSNIRTLEGALNKLLAFVSLTSIDIEQEITVEIAKEALYEYISKISIEITPDLVTKAVCKFFDIRDEEFLKSNTRKKEIVYPRHIAMYLIRELTGMSLPAIGQFFGGRDHTTVMHAIKKVNDGILTNNEAKRIIDSLIKDIKGEK